MPGVLCTAVVLIAVSAICGNAICRIAGYRARNTVAPAVGFAAVLTIAGVSIRAPGRTTASIVALAVVVGACVFALARRRSFDLLPLWALLMIPAVLAVATLPFWTSGHFGLLGVGTNDDLVEHLLASRTLQHGASLASSKLIAAGYPIGPHAVAATLSAATGIPLAQVFMGVLVAVPVLLALAAAALLEPGAVALRALAAGAVGLCYLQAAYLVQGSFKEPMEAVMLVASGGVMLELAHTARSRWLAAAPLAVVAAGSVYIYSYLGVLWIGAALAIWSLLGIAANGPSRTEILARARGQAASAVVAMGIFIALVAPEIPRMVRFSGSGYNREAGTILGDLLHPLSPFEALGIWPRLDFRFSVSPWSVGGVLTAVALAALVVCLVRSIRRRDFIVPALFLAAAGLYGLTQTRSPYTEAKALAVLAPTTTLLLARELLVSVPSRPRAGRWSLALPAVLAAVLATGAYADLEVLRDGPVGPTSHARQLASLGSIIGRRPTLFLGLDDYARWELRGANLTMPPALLYATAVAPIRLAKTRRARRVHDPLADPVTSNPMSGPGVFDFDSVPSSELDRFTFVILPRSPYTSQPPANWHLVRVLSSYELWGRIGPTPPHHILSEGRNLGAVLDCRTTAGRAIASRAGIAMVRPRPVVRGLRSWRGAVGYAGKAASQLVPLAAGTWDISIQYDSSVQVTVTAHDLRASLPANLDGVGPYFYVGAIHVARPQRVRVSVAFHRLSLFARLVGAVGLTRAPRPTGFRALGRIVFTRSPSGDRRLPLDRACGRYVDWYTLELARDRRA
jgi:hypothetical protein